MAEAAFSRRGRRFVYGLLAMICLMFVLGFVHRTVIYAADGALAAADVREGWAEVMKLAGWGLVTLECFRASGAVRRYLPYSLAFVAMWMVATLLYGVVLLTMMGLIEGLRWFSFPDESALAFTALLGIVAALLAALWNAIRRLCW